MSDLLKSIISGVIQGITEFLPISSDGHLALAHFLFDFNTSSNLLFDVVLHFGTLLAIMLYYRSKIRDLFVAFFFMLKTFFTSWNITKACTVSEDTRLVSLIFIGSVPTAIIGLLLKDLVEGYAKNLVIVGIGFLVTSLMMMLYEFSGKAYRKTNKMHIGDALLIGVMQGLAVMPGISRSGSTIGTAKALKIEKETAANFSFLLSLPAVAGAVLLESLDVIKEKPQVDWIVYGAGFLASFITGIFCLKLLFWLIRKHSMKVFMFYTFLLGIVTIMAGVM